MARALRRHVVAVPRLYKERGKCSIQMMRDNRGENYETQV